MDIIVKELAIENHIYLMDCNMRPLSIDVVSKDDTTDFIKSLIIKYNIEKVNVTGVIDYSKTPEYFIDHIG